MLPPFKKEFTRAQIDQINKAYQSGYQTNKKTN